VVNLFTGKARMFDTSPGHHDYEEVEIPAELRERAQQLRQELFEAIAATNDELLERYLEGGEITTDEALSALKTAMLGGELFPIFCGAAEKTWGMRTLLRALVKIVPSPSEAPHELAQRPNLDQVVELKGEDAAPLAALIFKTATEPHVGELSFFRIFSGAIANGQEVRNATQEAPEKLAHLAVPQGKERVEVAPACRRHRRRHQAEELAHERHADDGGPAGGAAADQLPGTGHRAGSARGEPQR
jgi:elongation factor G